MTLPDGFHVPAHSALDHLMRAPVVKALESGLEVNFRRRVAGTDYLIGPVPRVVAIWRSDGSIAPIPRLREW